MWEAQKLGPFPAVSNTLLSKAKRNDNQIWPEPSGAEQQSQHLVIFKALATVLGCCTMKALGAVLKDNNH